MCCRRCSSRRSLLLVVAASCTAALVWTIAVRLVKPSARLEKYWTYNMRQQRTEELSSIDEDKEHGPLEYQGEYWTDTTNTLNLRCLLPSCRPESPLHPEEQLLPLARISASDAVSSNAVPYTAGYSWGKHGVSMFVGRQWQDGILRLELAIPAAVPQLVHVRRIRQRRTVHIVVGVRRRYATLRQFLQHIIAGLLSSDPHFVLHLAYSNAPGEQRRLPRVGCSAEAEREIFSGNGSLEEANAGEDNISMESQGELYSERANASPVFNYKRKVDELLKGVHNLRWTWQAHECSTTSTGFSRGCILNAAIRCLKPDDLIMLCDVDMRIDAHALQRCRANTHRGSQAYFPISFSQYNPKGPFDLGNLSKRNYYGVPKPNTSKTRSFKLLKYNDAQFKNDNVFNFMTHESNVSHGLSKSNVSTRQKSFTTPLDHTRKSKVLSTINNSELLKMFIETKAGKDKENKKDIFSIREEGGGVKNEETINGEEAKNMQSDLEDEDVKYIDLLTGKAGFWRVFGFGMVCIIQEDFELAGGLPEMPGWGGEDLAFFSAVAGLQGMQVLRGLEPGLLHAYHHKDCDEGSGTDPAMLSQCLKSRVLNEASQMSFAAALLNYEGIV